MPASLAAARMVEPFGASHAIPFIVILTVSIILPPKNVSLKNDYCLEIAPNLHVDIHAPHFTHLAVSIAIAGSFLPGAV